MHIVRKHESPSLRLLVTLIHLALFAELGVLTRCFLDKLMVLGCDGGWGPCIQGGAYFKDLSSNLLGCFVIGLAAASSTLGLATDKALAVLPRGHAWQSNLELQIGIRTGYCGSLTTFASWMLELVIDGVESNQWVNSVLGLINGLFSSILCYVLGMHAALAVDRWLLGERYVLEERELYREGQLAFLEGLRADSGETPAQKLAEQAEPDLPRLVSVPLGQGLSALELETLQKLSPAVAGGGAAAAAAGAAEAAAGRAAVAAREDGGMPSDTHAELLSRLSARLQHRAAEAAERQRRQAEEQQREQDRRRQQDGAAGGGSSSKRHGRLTARLFLHSMAGYRTDAAALLALVLLSAGLAVGVGLEAEHQWLRQVWLSCLLGPGGCILRWWLSRWNYKLSGGWAWFPAGTFAANMLGTAVDFALHCVLVRQSAAVGYWGQVAVGAVMTGFCGSLTTVSTFVTEVVKFSEAVPENYRAHGYALLSLAGGVVLGLALFGWTVWAA